MLVHRALLGSVERMMAILIEHTGGNWPLWLSPRQISICPVSADHLTYAESIQNTLTTAGYYVEISKRPADSISKKVRTAVKERFNFLLILGDKEVESKTVSVRTRAGEVSDEPVTIEAFITQLDTQIQQEMKGLHEESPVMSDDN